MKRFAELYAAIDRTTKTNEKLDALVSYFREAPEADAAWALFFLTGNTIPRPVPTRVLRQWVADAAKIPLWLLEESYHIVGDLAETFALILRPESQGTSLSLSEIVDLHLIPLTKLPESERKEKLFKIWLSFDPDQAFLFMKLVTGSMRIGVQKALIARALSKISNLPQAQIDHRLMGGAVPTAEYFQRILDPELTPHDPGQPFPFCLAYPLEAAVESLGRPEDWQVEWKWDGIRAQCIRRAENLLLWSRGEEAIADTFPELAVALSELPPGTVLDGEILAWRNDHPLPFGELQRRLGRKKVSKKFMEEVPVHYLAYDILEHEGEDIRQHGTAERRAILTEKIALLNSPLIGISTPLQFNSWTELAQIRTGSREAFAEGCMLKLRSAPYGAGRRRGLWWKWKVEPHTCDAVLVYAQRGHGRRAGLFTDYTFAVWKEGELVPVAKAYSGLTDKEFTEVNRFIRGNTLERFGPVVTVEPQLVFELAFDDIRVSNRHKAGLALRFPRMLRMRTDKLPRDADSVETLLALVPSL